MADSIKIIVNNRKARRDYEILNTYEAGLQLRGTEVKALREGRANLKDSYARIEGNEAFLHKIHISEYAHGNQFNHEPERKRKLLLHRYEIERLRGQTEEKGLTLIPLKLYFKRGKAKVEIGVARGKRQFDKRRDIARRDAQREIEYALKARIRNGR
jgi:SsrA-binding protein